MLVSICAAVLAMSASHAGASPNGLVAASEVPASLQTNTADAGGGPDRLVVGTFTDESVSRDVAKMGVKAEGLAPNPTSGASTGVVFAVFGAIVFGFAALLTSNQGRRGRRPPEKPKVKPGKRKKKHVPF